jgi:flagellar motor switch protein FliM
MAQLCLEISPLIIYPIIDRLLGGSNADLFIPQRPLTQIEQRLVQRITDRATHHLSEAWSNLTPVTFSACRILRAIRSWCRSFRRMKQWWWSASS